MREAQPGVVVTVNGRPLQHVVRHSPTGFEWGYGGSGPADLALSILTDYLGDVYLIVHTDDGEMTREHTVQIADRLYQEFKWQFIAPLDCDRPWRITGQQISDWLRAKGFMVGVRDVVYEGRRFA
ncbi:MAG TPA: DUF6166 domain-containing protein [Thermaerobacter sp.]